jgi:DNA-binding response OmpR family regulator
VINYGYKSTIMTSNTIPIARKRFLVVEDEEDIANLIALHLTDLEADVTIANNGRVGLEYALNEQWDAILLDLRLPEIDGLDICRAIRMKARFMPILMLTSRDTELDRVLGLEIGADDYMVKPFSVAELKARVKALMRRTHQYDAPSEIPAVNTINYRDLTLDQSSRIAKVNNHVLELTAKEFDLLWFFAAAPGRVFKRAELLDKVWGYGYEGYEHTVNSHINRLRSKLEAASDQSQYIQTIWGVGYRFGEQEAIL